MEHIRDRAYAVLRANRREYDGHRYTVPAPTEYPYQWLWDSCFHAIALTHFNIEEAKDELRSLFAHQLGDGLIPHIMYWRETVEHMWGREKQGHLITKKWGRDGTSSITQPPLIAEAVHIVYERSGDRAFIEETYPKLVRYYEYLIRERDPRGNHLVSIVNPDESGEDNSPRFDAAQGLPLHHTAEENLARRVALMERLQACNFETRRCMKEFFWVKDVPFNVIFVRGLGALAALAETLGKHDDAAVWRATSAKTVHAMRERMLGEEGVMWSLQGADYIPIRLKTWAILAPLLTHALTKAEQERLIEAHFKKGSGLRAAWGVRTVSEDEPSYDPTDFWRGPIWMAPHWFLYRAFTEHGFAEEAAWMRERTLALLDHSGFCEYYHPDTGEGLGARNFTWGALAVDMFE